MLRFLTAGESHGPSLVMILEGMPAGLAIDFDAITAQLRRRQGGYGRGRRMAIESDRAQALSGIHGKSVQVNVVLDPEVVGGIRVQVGDEVVDGTILRRLEEARRLIAG